jgi:hypothetical protein
MSESYTARVSDGPCNPKDVIDAQEIEKHIEKRSFDQVVRERDFSTQQWRDWNAKADALAEQLKAHDASASMEIDRLRGALERITKASLQHEEPVSREIARAALEGKE